MKPISTRDSSTSLKLHVTSAYVQSAPRHIFNSDKQFDSAILVHPSELGSQMEHAPSQDVSSSVMDANIFEGLSSSVVEVSMNTPAAQGVTQSSTLDDFGSNADSSTHSGTTPQVCGRTGFEDSLPLFGASMRPTQETDQSERSPSGDWLSYADFTDIFVAENTQSHGAQSHPTEQDLCENYLDTHVELSQDAFDPMCHEFSAEQILSMVSEKRINAQSRRDASDPLCTELSAENIISWTAQGRYKQHLLPVPEDMELDDFFHHAQDNSSRSDVQSLIEIQRDDIRLISPGAPCCSPDMGPQDTDAFGPVSPIRQHVASLLTTYDETFSPTNVTTAQGWKSHVQLAEM